LRISTGQREKLKRVKDELDKAVQEAFQSTDTSLPAWKRVVAAVEPSRKSLEATLLPAQIERLNGISLQYCGANVFKEPTVIGELGLTSAQIARIAPILQKREDQIRELVEKSGVNIPRIDSPERRINQSDFEKGRRQIDNSTLRMLRETLNLQQFPMKLRIA